MFERNREIVWMPILSGDTLRVVLLHEFAVACSKCKIGETRDFEHEVWNRSQLSGQMPPNFLDLPDGTILPRGFYKNDNGAWLSSGGNPLDVLCEENAVIYNGHNEERARLWFLRAFQAWVEAASVQIDWK